MEDGKTKPDGGSQALESYTEVVPPLEPALAQKLFREWLKKNESWNKNKNPEASNVLLKHACPRKTKWPLIGFSVREYPNVYLNELTSFEIKIYGCLFKIGKFLKLPSTYSHVDIVLSPAIDINYQSLKILKGFYEARIGPIGLVELKKKYFDGNSHKLFTNINIVYANDIVNKLKENGINAEIGGWH